MENHKNANNTIALEKFLVQWEKEIKYKKLGTSLEDFAFQGKGSRQSGLSRNSPILHSLKGDWCGENLTVSIKPMDPLHPTPLTWDCPKVEPHVGHQN